MKLSPVGLMVVTVGALAGIAVWVVGFIGLPNIETHKNLAENPKIDSSALQTQSSGGSGAASSGVGTTSTAPWYTLDKSAKTLDLAITSATTTENSGMNFNGGFNGSTVITVPVGWTINVTFANKDSTMPHSVGFTTWSSKSSGTGTFTPAFPNSIGPKFSNGMTSSDPAVKFSFTASNAGKFAYVCGVPGHAAGGMWDEFDVSNTAKVPTVKIGTQTMTVE